MKLKATNVWDVLEKILGGEEQKQGNMHG